MMHNSQFKRKDTYDWFCGHVIVISVKTHDTFYYQGSLKLLEKLITVY